MSHLYQVGLKPPPDEEFTWTRPLEMDAAVRRALDIARKPWRKGKGYRLTLRGDTYGPVRTLKELGEGLRRRLPGTDVGDVCVVWCLANDAKVWVRTVSHPVVPANTEGTPDIDWVYGLLRVQAQGLWLNWGIKVCRYIGDSWTISQHAYGNALDVHPTSMVSGDHIFNLLRDAKAGEGANHIGTVLWRVSGHYDHLHIEGNPALTGSPGCTPFHR